MALLCLLLSHNELFAWLPETAFKNQIMASALWNSFSGPFVWPLHTTSFVADQTSQLIAASFLSFSLFWWRWGREGTPKGHSWLYAQWSCLEHVWKCQDTVKASSIQVSQHLFLLSLFIAPTALALLCWPFYTLALCEYCYLFCLWTFALVATLCCVPFSSCCITEYITI